MHVDLSPLVNAGLEGLAGILLALLSVAATFLMRKLKLEGDTHLRDAVASATENAVDFALLQAKTSADKAASDVVIKNQVLAHAATYMTQQVPATLKKLGVGDERSVANLVTAELGGRIATGTGP